MNTWSDESTWPRYVIHALDPRQVECDVECCDCDAKNCDQREQEDLACKEAEAQADELRGTEDCR